MIQLLCYKAFIVYFSMKYKNLSSLLYLKLTSIKLHCSCEPKSHNVTVNQRKNTYIQTSMCKIKKIKSKMWFLTGRLFGHDEHAYRWWTSAAVSTDCRYPPAIWRRTLTFQRMTSASLQRVAYQGSVPPKHWVKWWKESNNYQLFGSTRLRHFYLVCLLCYSNDSYPMNEVVKLINVINVFCLFLLFSRG